MSNTSLARNIEIGIAQECALSLIGVSAECSLWTLTAPPPETLLQSLPEAPAAVSDSVVSRLGEHLIGIEFGP